MQVTETYKIGWDKIQELSEYCEKFDIELLSRNKTSREWVESFSDSMWDKHIAVNGLFMRLSQYLIRHNSCKDDPATIEGFLSSHAYDYWNESYCQYSGKNQFLS